MRRKIFFGLVEYIICLNIPESLSKSIVSFHLKKIREKIIFLDFVKQDAPLRDI